MAEAGWYPLPSDPTKVIYYDGKKWVGKPVDAPEGVAEKNRGGDGLLGTAAALAGGTALADGVYGIGKRKGIVSAFISFLFGVVLIVLGANTTSFFESLEQRPDEQRFVATVISVGDNCSPTVAIDGAPYALSIETVQANCPVTVGEEVPVFESAGSVRLAPGAKLPLAPITWTMMGMGLVVAVLGLGQVIRKGLMIVGGATLLGEGLKSRREARSKRGG